MAVKNFWSFNPGETIVAEQLLSRFRDKIELYFPVKDTGIDLLAVNRRSKKAVSFQIKESRYYDLGKGSAWHQEDKKKILRNKDRVDFYVFVIYYPGYLAGAKKKSAFVIHYVIVPMKDLFERLTYKTPNNRGMYNFYFKIDGENVLEVREKKANREENSKYFDFSKYFNAWELIKIKIGE